MDNYLIINDFNLINGLLNCSFSKDEETINVKACLKNTKLDLIHEIDVVKNDDNYAVSVDVKDEKFVCGTYYLVISIDGMEYHCKFRDMTNDKNVGRMIELSDSKLFYDPVGKTHIMGSLDKDGIFTIRKWGDRNPGISKNPLYVSEYEVDDEKVSFTLKKPLNGTTLQAEIWFVAKGLKKVKRMSIDNHSGEIDSFAIPRDFIYGDDVPEEENRRLWEVYFVCNVDGTYRFARVEISGSKKFRKTALKKTKADETDLYVLIQPVKDQYVQFYFNKQCRLCRKQCDASYAYKEVYRGEINSYKRIKDDLYIWANKPLAGFTDPEFLLRSIDDVTREQKDYKFQKVSGNGEYCYKISYNDVTWDHLKYELIMVAYKDGVAHEFRVIKAGNHMINLLDNIYKNCFYSNNGKIVYFTETIGEKLVIENRALNQYDSYKYRKNENIAKVLGFFAKRTPKRNIALFYEKFCTAAQDNSFYMFEYFVKREGKHHLKPFYIIEKDAPDYKRLKKEYGKRIVPFMSVKHLVMIQCAKIFISTDSKRHCYKWRGGATKLWRSLADKYFAFLQHGVLGFKRVDDIYCSQFINRADMFVASSEYEREIIEKYFGYDKKQITITGLARWDMLCDKSKDNEEKLIFYMPTWRNWIFEADNEEFVNSDYYKAYKNILRDEKLDKILKKNNAKLLFCLHPKFRKFSDTLKSNSENIQIVDFADCKINELIMKCNMMITDYSSASWDVFYLDKPVLFYQFDCDKYLDCQGAYINFNNGLFGDRAIDHEEFLEKLEKIIDSGFACSDNDKVMKQRYSLVKDNNNRERIYNEILSRI